MAYLEGLLPEFRNGVRIRRKDWDEDVFIYFDEGLIYWKDSGAWKDGKLASTKDLISIFIFHDNDWEIYQDPINWDDIIKSKCLCWFWDVDENYKSIERLACITDNSDYPFENIRGVPYRNCHPVRKDEITFYENKNDD